jgi:hypothetical protein
LSTDVAIRELDWYLRDHLFRQSNAGKTMFRRELLPSEMAALYLRYMGADLQQLSDTMTSVIEGLIARKVLEQNGNELRLLGMLSRLQCANTKCFYINYLAESEPRACLRCQHGELHDFPKKKA